MDTLRNLVLGLCLAAASGAALAQADKCASVPENMRARCEEGMRVKEKCAGLEGAALKECQQKSVSYGATKMNCTAMQGEARIRCEQSNKAMEAAAPCTGKAGAELERCAKEQGIKAR
jgi:hypothetical protein